jgi:IS605 OrfB family transposase
MNHTSSYSIEFKNNLRAVKNTVLLYRKAVEYLTVPVKDHYEKLEKIKGANYQQQYIEHLVHSTKNHKAVYDFDKQFYKFPSYFRRSAITHAIGAVSSYMSNHKLWKENGCKGSEPKLGTDMNICPCFFHKNMFLWKEDGKALIKVYTDNDWVWKEITLKKTDLKYFRKRINENPFCSVSSPVIERKQKGHYFLRFTLTEKVELSSSALSERLICSVDLGLNTDAVCSVMNVHGTVLARRFISCAREKDSVHNALHRISVFQKLHGSHDTGRLWSIAKRRNENHAKLIAHHIAAFAKENHCDVIVFEHLDTKGKKRGSKKQKLSLWRHRDIQKTAESLAHKHGMKISHVNAWNTSKLAYDGSGYVKRGKAVKDGTSYSMCQFESGKMYNCDLNASYNIGARYFIRELHKELPGLMAEVPEIGSGTRRVLADLWRIDAAISQ